MHRNPDDKHDLQRKADLDDHLHKMYNMIEDLENLPIAAKTKMAIVAEKLPGDNIFDGNVDELAR